MQSNSRQQASLAGERGDSDQHDESSNYLDERTRNAAQAKSRSKGVEKSKKEEKNQAGKSEQRVKADGKVNLLKGEIAPFGDDGLKWRTIEPLIHEVGVHPASVVALQHIVYLQIEDAEAGDRVCVHWTICKHGGNITDSFVSFMSADASAAGGATPLVLRGKTQCCDGCQWSQKDNGKTDEDRHYIINDVLHHDLKSALWSQARSTIIYAFAGAIFLLAKYDSKTNGMGETEPRLGKGKGWARKPLFLPMHQIFAFLGQTSPGRGAKI